MRSCAPYILQHEQWWMSVFLFYWPFCVVRLPLCGLEQEAQRATMILTTRSIHTRPRDLGTQPNSVLHKAQLLSKVLSTQTKGRILWDANQTWHSVQSRKTKVDHSSEASQLLVSPSYVAYTFKHFSRSVAKKNKIPARLQLLHRRCPARQLHFPQHPRDLCHASKKHVALELLEVPSCPATHDPPEVPF